MTIFKPATPYSNSIVRSPCSKCNNGMLLSRLEPQEPDHDKRLSSASSAKTLKVLSSNTGRSPQPVKASRHFTRRSDTSGIGGSCTSVKSLRVLSPIENP
jgi:hypothetical protein